MKKLVTVIKELRYQYSVEGECEDAQALAIVRQRLQAGAPIGLESEQEKILSFEVQEGNRREVYDAEGHLAKTKKRQST